MTELKQLVRPNILELKPYSSARSEFSGESSVWLDANENPFGALNRYPDPRQLKLKQRLSEIKNVPMDNIFIGNGSDEAIDLCFRIFCEPKRDKALTFTPTYGMYEVSAKINDVELFELALDENFQIDFETFEKLPKENLKLLLVCSPNNPTGNRLENLEKLISGFDGIVVLDEAYADFCPESSLLQKLSEFPNLILLQTLSKAYGLAGLRIGMAFSSPEIIGFFDKVKPPYNVSGTNQKLALEALSDEIGFRNRLKILKNERQMLMEILAQIPCVQKVFPTDANFILARFQDANRVYSELLKAGIVTRNRSVQIENTLRITVGTPEENRKLLQTLKQIL